MQYFINCTLCRVHSCSLFHTVSIELSYAMTQSRDSCEEFDKTSNEMSNAEYANAAASGKRERKLKLLVDNFPSGTHFVEYGTSIMRYIIKRCWICTGTYNTKTIHQLKIKNCLRHICACIHITISSCSYTYMPHVHYTTHFTVFNCCIYVPGTHSEDEHEEKNREPDSPSQAVQVTTPKHSTVALHSKVDTGKNISMASLDLIFLTFWNVYRYVCWTCHKHTQIVKYACDFSSKLPNVIKSNTMLRKCTCLCMLIFLDSSLYVYISLYGNCKFSQYCTFTFLNTLMLYNGIV